MFLDHRVIEATTTMTVAADAIAAVRIATEGDGAVALRSGAGGVARRVEAMFHMLGLNVFDMV